MPISSGALDWPISYYSRPPDVAANGDAEFDPWAREHAYKNWTWKTKRGKKRKRRQDPDEVRRHRRRCCCCVVWWLATLALILLALILFMVFWIHERGHDVPRVPLKYLDQMPKCKGDIMKDYVLYNKFGNQSTTICCTDPGTISTVKAKTGEYISTACPAKMDAKPICTPHFPFTPCAACRHDATIAVVLIVVFWVNIYM